jgi:hypothetical protein
MAIVFCDVNATGLNDGTTWENAYTSLQTAINNATPTTDQVWVKEGTFTLTATINNVSNVDVYGGFNSALTGTNGVISGRDYWVDETILDGAQTYRIMNAANNRLDGLIFFEGYYVGPGAGLYANTVSPTVVNCKFDSCVSDSSVVADGGGAIYYINSLTATVTNCIFKDNVSTGSRGGAIYLRSGPDLTITNSHFVNNIAYAYGGALYSTIAPSIITCENCIFEHNSATTNRGGAGTFVSTAILKRCRVNDNTAFIGGGAFWTNVSLTLKESLIYNNEATTGDGGGISHAGGTSDIINSTFNGNTAFATGDAIQGGSGCTVKNCVVWNGSSGISSGTAVTYSNVEGGYTGTGNKNADPLFIGTCYDPANPYNIRPGSPCIDCADAGAPAETTDILGNARYDDPATPNTGVGSPPYVDMGCYEYQGCLPDAYVDLGVEF